MTLRAITSFCLILCSWTFAQHQLRYESQPLGPTHVEIGHILEENAHRGVFDEFYLQEPGDVAFWKIDEYGSISLEEERARLDEFARRLRGQPTTRAYIIAYGGRRSWPGEARDRAKCVKDYLVKKFKISSRRLLTVDGGYQKESVVELYLGENGAPPLASPTVEPHDVQIIKDRMREQHRVCLLRNTRR